MPPFPSTHKRCRSTEMEYLFVYASELQSTQFNMYCITRGRTGMEQMFTFPCVGWWWNVVQVGMLHQCKMPISPPV